MGLALDAVSGKKTFPRGTHPPEQKHFSAESPIEIMPGPKEVAIALVQHSGAPSEPIVKIKQEVAFGEMVAKGKGFISASHHAPIAGVVQKTAVMTLPNGRHMNAVVIRASEKQLEGADLWNEIYGGEWAGQNTSHYRPQQIAEAAYNAGIVGLGGAAFPTHVKITHNEKAPVDTLLINGCECEPYLTCDYRLMLEAPEPIILGALLAARAAGAKNVIIGVEDNKPRAVDVLRKAARGKGIVVCVLKTKYPQGSEKQLIKAVLNREVPVGLLPLNVGVLVMNVGTAAALARAVHRNMPLTHRVICVTGDGIKNPKNVLAPIGVSYEQIIEFCGGLTEDAARIVSGGPMMGFSFSDLTAPITKGTSGITVLTRGNVQKEAETACVRCGRCVDVCPMNLVPTKCALASRCQDMGLAQRYHIMACFECGCCAYACPANIPLVQLIRMGKTMILSKKK